MNLSSMQNILTKAMTSVSFGTVTIDGVDYKMNRKRFSKDYALPDIGADVVYQFSCEIKQSLFTEKPKSNTVATVNNEEYVIWGVDEDATQSFYILHLGDE